MFGVFLLLLILRFVVKCLCWNDVLRLLKLFVKLKLVLFDFVWMWLVEFFILMLFFVVMFSKFIDCMVELVMFMFLLVESWRFDFDFKVEFFVVEVCV